MNTLSLAILILAGAPLTSWAEVTKMDIQKLTAAGISEDIVLTFIRRNGPIVPLSADDLVELKRAGVGDRVLAALLPGTPVAPALSPPPPAVEAAGPGPYVPPAPPVAIGAMDYAFSDDPWCAGLYSSFGFWRFGSSCSPRYRTGCSPTRTAFPSCHSVAPTACPPRGTINSGGRVMSSHVRR